MFRNRSMLISVFAALALVVGFAQPATANPYWQAFTTDSSWRCTATAQHPGATNIYYQGCVVVSGSYMQTVLVVSNQSSSAVTIFGEVYNSNGPGWTCNTSTFSPGYRRACFGDTTQMAPCELVTSVVVLHVNGVDRQQQAPEVRNPCLAA